MGSVHLAHLPLAGKLLQARAVINGLGQCKCLSGGVMTHIPPRRAYCWVCVVWGLTLKPVIHCTMYFNFRHLLKSITGSVPKVPAVFVPDSRHLSCVPCNTIYTAIELNKITHNLKEKSDLSVLLVASKAIVLHLIYFSTCIFESLHLTYRKLAQATIFTQHEWEELLLFSDHMVCNLMGIFNASVTFLPCCCHFIMVSSAISRNGNHFNVVTVDYFTFCQQACRFDLFNQTANRTKECSSEHFSWQ